MATMQLQSNTQKDQQRRNPDKFSLIWLNTEESDDQLIRQTQQKLRSVVSHFILFHDLDKCEKYIDEMPQNSDAALIITSEFDASIVSNIHYRSEILSIFIYNPNNRCRTIWINESQKLQKVHSATNSLDELIDTIKSDHRIVTNFEEPLEIKNFHNKDQSTAELDGKFVQYQVLMDLILDIPGTETDRDELIELCKNTYKRDPIQCDIVKEFQADYKKDKALWWYTRDSFLYQILNQALRSQDIQQIFLLRSICYDIYCQLKKYQCESRIRVFRGQRMSVNEVKALENSINELICIKSFFSTSVERQAALPFLRESQETAHDYQHVLFEITADPSIKGHKNFADISKHSDFSKEGEVLFMFGAIFRIKKVTHGDGGICTIQIELSGDNDHDLKDIIDHMRLEYDKKGSKFRALGLLLQNMSELELAENYLERLYTTLPSNHSLRKIVCDDLSNVTSMRKNANASLEWKKASLQLSRNKTDQVNNENESVKKSASKKAGCGGYACDRCGHCSDWYFLGGRTTLDWIGQNANWTDKDWEEWEEKQVAEQFIRCDGSTCRDFLFHYRRETFSLFNNGRNVHFFHLFNFRDYHIRRFPLCRCERYI